MAPSDFSLNALYNAIDEQRHSRGLSWAALAREVNRFKMDRHPIASSTITGLKSKRVAEGDGILQMLLWLGRTPESFCPGFPEATAPRYHLRDLPQMQILRFDTKALHAALNAQREAKGMTWREVADEIGGFTP